jgi:preprotein translocase subunit SecD
MMNNLQIQKPPSIFSKTPSQNTPWLPIFSTEQPVYSEDQKGISNGLSNLPVTPPKQNQVVAEEKKPVEDIVTTYRNRIKRMVSRERFINQQYKEVDSRTWKNKNAEKIEKFLRKQVKPTFTTSDLKYNFYTSKSSNSGLHLNKISTK